MQLGSTTGAIRLRPAIGVGIGRVAYDATSEGLAATTGAAERAIALDSSPFGKFFPFATTSFAVEHAWGPLHTSLVSQLGYFRRGGPVPGGGAHHVR